jgi:hypothetical protein
MNEVFKHNIKPETKAELQPMKWNSWEEQQNEFEWTVKETDILKDKKHPIFLQYF